ncbi:STAS/SEC14 domain-containing protein [candidate division WOR-3 bacterium]|nr:STAS/SEC14 domain-containing protein [candidate division WOR-3 bacterium]
MEHKIYYDKELDTVCVDVIDEFKLQDIDGTFEVIDKHFQDADYYRLLIDLSQSNGALSTKARRMLGEKLKAKNSAKIAFVITRPSSRMIAKVVVALSKGSDEKGFFKTRDQAHAWLREKR